jgi:hypothetical protein
MRDNDMNTTTIERNGRRRERNRWFVSRAAVALVAFVLPLVACQGLLDVSDPDIVTPDNLADELGIQTLRNGALGNFVLAYAGGGQTDNQIMNSGLMSDEWMHSGTYPTRQEVELRIIPIDNTTMDAVYLNLHRARVDLEGAAEKIRGFVSDPNADGRIPEMLAYAGFTYIAFGENYCSGVPFSVAPDEGPIEFGEPQTTEQIFERAVARFDEVIAHAAASDAILNMARVGRGRALLNLNQPDAAASAVAAVPDEFVIYTEHSNNSGRERNDIYEFNYTAKRWSVGDNEGINGLDFRSSGDPRIVAELDPRMGFDETSELWVLKNYQSRSDAVAIVTGVEARLIEAEAALRNGDAAGWLVMLNQLRADFATLAPILYRDNPPSGVLAPLADPGTTVAREDLMFRERAFWLFSTSHRLGDMRRLIRQYGRDAESVFPTGPYFKAGSNYGTDVNFPIPQDERNNPNFTGCLNRNP